MACQRKTKIMPRTKISRCLHLAALLLAATSLSACGNTFDRLAHVGQQPAVNPVQNPAERQGPVTMPMPTPSTAERQANSLWRPGSRAFLKDQRASQVGDIITVVMTFAGEGGSLAGTNSRTRGNTETTGATNLLGYESSIWNRLPGTQGTITPSTLLGLNGTTSQTGAGTTTRTDAVTSRVAAVVTQVLPNGNLVIQGSSEMRLNYETRQVGVAGVIRPSDIDRLNQINYDRIAEARFAYGGRGQINDMLQPRWGNQVLDVIFPF
jgi:flagellar L-ring protein FlgH